MWLHIAMAFDDFNHRFVEAQRRLVSQASDFSLETIASMVDSLAIDPSPQYQRRQRWDFARQSALIESFLLNVPVPPVYLAEEDFGVYSVIDGKQRITAIHDYMRGQFALRSLAELPELNGARIGDLPESMSNALRMRPYIRAVTLLKQSDPELKFEVFLRLNRGGESLTPQEVRNVAFRGPLNDLILRLSDNGFLRQQFNIVETSERYRQMQDAEFVLRFLTLREVWPNFGGDLAAAMDSFMLHNSRRHPDELFEYADQFRYAVDACARIWGDYAYRRSENGQWRGRALLGMYDAQMLAVSLVDDETVQRAAAKRHIVIERTARLFDNSEFLAAATVATNTSARLRYRVDQVAQLLVES